MARRLPEMKLSNLRCFHWGIVFLCFFLPSVVGCDKKIVYPYQEFFNLDNWLQSSLYLYPIAVLLIFRIVLKIVKVSFRFPFAWSIAYGLFLLLSYMIFKVCMDTPENYFMCLVFLWGIMAFGLLRGRDEQQLIDLIGFSVSAFFLWLFPFVYLFNEKILYGGWLYIYASSVVLLTYGVELCNQRKMLFRRGNAI